MTEGTFPKVNGDILYASEVNLMSLTTPLFSSTGSSLVKFIGEATNNLGSFVIKAGTKGMGFFGTIYVGSGTNGGGRAAPYISGLSVLNFNEATANTPATFDQSTPLYFMQPFPYFSGTNSILLRAVKDVNAGSIVLRGLDVWAAGCTCSGSF